MKGPSAGWKLAHEGPLVVGAEHFSVRSTWGSHLWNLTSEQDRPVFLYTIQSKSVSMSFKTPRCTTMLFTVAVVLFVIIVFSCLN